MRDKIAISLLEENVQVNEILAFLKEIDEDFKPKLSSRISLSSYAKKLSSNAVFALATLDSKIIGMTAFYANDIHKKTSYLPVFGVKENYRGMGIASQLLDLTISFLKEKGFQRLSLETWLGSHAQIFYQRKKFIVERVEKDRGAKFESVKMFRWIGEIGCCQGSFDSTKLEYRKNLSDELSVNLFVKRDDLYPKFGGGNKARKLDYILNKAKNEGHDSIVTTGASQSNHCRATALYAAALGWKATIIIHDIEPNIYQGNLKLMKLAGAELRFVGHNEVKEAMDKAMDDFKITGYNPYYIWGGGHSVEGALAYFEAVKELKSQLGNITPDYIVVASGTGTTQAGIEIGVRHFYPQCEIIGVSVAREEARGKREILKSMDELNIYLDRPVLVPEDITFDTTVSGSGYEKFSPELIDSVQKTIEKGLLVDPTYTGKAFHTMKTYIHSGRISRGKNVVFWHTGGLMNLLSSPIV